MDEGEKRLEPEEMEGTRRTWPTTSTKQGSRGFTKVEMTSHGPAWVCTRPFVHMLLLLASRETPNNGSRYSFDSFDSPWGSFPPTGLPYPVLIWGILPDLIVSLFCLVRVLCFRDPLLSEEEPDEEWIWGRSRRSRGSRNCDWDLLYERRIYFQLKKVQGKRILFSSQKDKWKISCVFPASLTI